jgi:hypothetical protein
MIFAREEKGELISVINGNDTFQQTFRSLVERHSREEKSGVLGRSDDLVDVKQSSATSFPNATKCSSPHHHEAKCSRAFASAPVHEQLKGNFSASEFIKNLKPSSAQLFISPSPSLSWLCFWLNGKFISSLADEEKSRNP